MILGLGRLYLKHLVMFRKIHFYRHLYISDNCMLQDVFWTLLLCDEDEMVKTIYVKKHTAFKMVYDKYELYTAIP